MIHWDKIGEEEIFSDDSAQLNAYCGWDAARSVRDWLTDGYKHSYYWYVQVRKPIQAHYEKDEVKIDYTALTIEKLAFRIEYFTIQQGIVRLRMFRAARSTDLKFQILGVEVDPEDGHQIGPVPESIFTRV